MFFRMLFMDFIIFYLLNLSQACVFQRDYVVTKSLWFKEKEIQEISLLTHYIEIKLEKLSVCKIAVLVDKICFICNEKVCNKVTTSKLTFHFLFSKIFHFPPWLYSKQIFLASKVLYFQSSTYRYPHYHLVSLIVIIWM